MSIHFNHTGLHAQKNKRAITRTVEKVVDSGQFLDGLQNNTLNKKLRDFFKYGYVTTVASGHDALYLALQIIRSTSADEVIFPVNAYPTAFPIFLSRVKPVPVDVDENGQIDPKAVQKKITKNTKAIIVVHLYGLIAPIETIIHMIKGKNIVLIEDCAQAFGSRFKGKIVGTYGDIGCFSFYPTKNLGTLGDGGAIWTNNKKYYDFFLKAKNYGEVIKNHSEFVSFHSRLPEIQAGILNIYLKQFKVECEKKNIVFQEYRTQCTQNKLNQYIRILYQDCPSAPILNLFVVEVQQRDALKKYLETNGIMTSIHYPTPIHLIFAFSSLGYANNDFPIAERLSQNILTLPFHPYLTKKDIIYITQSIRTFYYG